MAFRPYENLIEGALDNTIPGIITGRIRFFHLNKKPLECRLKLIGDFHDDIKGKVLLFRNPNPHNRPIHGPDSDYMERFSSVQYGQAGDISCKDYPYIEWYSNTNGRMVLELDPSQAAVAESMPPEFALKRSVC